MLAVKYPPFRSHLPGDRHLQTIAPVLLARGGSDYQSTRRVVTLFDGDRLVVHDDQPPAWVPGDRVAILLHGLGGCHGSPYMKRVSYKLRRRGVRTLRVDMRGFGDSALISRHHMHAGCSADLQAVVATAVRFSPKSKISLIGFSLGANVLLKTLGEWCNKFPHGVDSAIAVAPPIDLTYCAWNLRRGGNRIYDAYFVRRLQTSLARRRRKVADLVDNHLNPLPDRLLQFDDQFTAPVWGYRGAKDYYQQCSAAPLMGKIHVPTIIVTSRDDPVVPFDMFANWPLSPTTELVATQAGGHLGFLGRNCGDPDRHWLDWRICDWLSALDEPRE